MVNVHIGGTAEYHYHITNSGAHAKFQLGEASSAEVEVPRLLFACCPLCVVFLSSKYEL